MGSVDDIKSPSKPILAAGEIGKGRAVVSGDTFFMMPFRLDDGDNAKLMWNILCWITKDKIKQKTGDELKKQIWFDENAMAQIAREER
ncbi:MAG TPA: hypothetical protein DC049_07725 [Spirochaetia bacterium]|nr:hypothetical protein [Spirochaetia bacterium]